MNTTPHNPDNLTPKQVGEGWRLLDDDEVIFSIQTLKEMEGWSSKLGWVDYCVGNRKETTYRTRLSRDELRKARGLEEERDVVTDALETIGAQTYQMPPNELSSLRADKARLDWLEANPIHTIGFSQDLKWLTFNGKNYPTLRSAIDAAMKGETE